MGACRENRPSENTLNNVISSVRNLDKILWHGQKWSVEDVQEYADSIKRNLDIMVQQFKKEMGYVEPPPRPSCGCHPQPIPTLPNFKNLEPLKNTLGDKPEVPPTNILGDKDWPCEDPKCDCHKE